MIQKIRARASEDTNFDQLGKVSRLRENTPKSGDITCMLIGDLDLIIKAFLHQLFTFFFSIAPEIWRLSSQWPWAWLWRGDNTISFTG